MAAADPMCSKTLYARVRPPLPQYNHANEIKINFRMRVTLNDGRQMTGEMLAFDRVRSLPLYAMSSLHC